MPNIDNFGDVTELEEVEIQRLLRQTEEKDYLMVLRCADDASKEALYRTHDRPRSKYDSRRA